MSTSAAKEQVLKLLEEEGFLTVKRLSERLYISQSSIRRYLTDLQNAGLVHRTHGGVTLAEAVSHLPSLNNRMTQNTVAKRKVAKKAASLLEDGMIVMLDGSSTASFLLPYLAKKRDLVLYTSNLETALGGIAMGIETHCIGGRSVNHSAALAGEAAYKAVCDLCPDLLFFSSQCIDRDGVVTDSNVEENHLRQLMLRNCKKSVFLCDSQKFATRAAYRLASLSDFTFAAFDLDDVLFPCGNCSLLP